jgi:hypothetical protein
LEKLDLSISSSYTGHGKACASFLCHKRAIVAPEGPDEETGLPRTKAQGKSYTPTKSAAIARRTPPRAVWAGPVGPVRLFFLFLFLSFFLFFIFYFLFLFLFLFGFFSVYFYFRSNLKVI